MTRVSRQMHDLRPLNNVDLTPPDYRINPQYLIDGCVETEVKVNVWVPCARALALKTSEEFTITVLCLYYHRYVKT